jgi:predicted O-methyltransferase YrrM
MDYAEPFEELESAQNERAAVAGALEVLREVGALPHARYDDSLLAAHREAVRARFDIPWTAISPRMERLIWAINSIAQPSCMIAAGVFCGFTYVCNAGAGTGPGASFVPELMIGVELKPESAALAERNMRTIDPGGRARVLAGDAVKVCAMLDRPVDLLYLDATGPGETGKGVYFDILDACYDNMLPGALALAHNSVNSAEKLGDYLAVVRDPHTFSASVNCMVDPEGLEVSVK